MKNSTMADLVFDGSSVYRLLVATAEEVSAVDLFV